MMRFPKMHIAQSVVNRILNTADELNASRQQIPSGATPMMPNIPDPTLEGAVLDSKLSGEVPPVSSPPPGMEEDVATSVATGGTPWDGIIAPAQS